MNTTILDRFIELAEKEIGIHASSNETHPNPRILEYLDTVRIHENKDYVPWCSAFVNFVIEEAGLKGTDNAMARSWLEWGRKIIEPVKGCIVVCKRGVKPWLGHVGFYMGETPTFVKILGGNQSNQVSIENFYKNSVIQFRVPLNY